jgi:hypothetical protein
MTDTLATVAPQRHLLPRSRSIPSQNRNSLTLTLTLTLTLDIFTFSIFTFDQSLNYRGDFEDMGNILRLLQLENPIFFQRFLHCLLETWVSQTIQYHRYHFKKNRTFKKKLKILRIKICFHR